MEFEFGRLRRADRIMAGGAVALFIFILLPWYGGKASGGVAGDHVVGSLSASGWEAFTSQRWLWVFTIIATLTSVLLAAIGRRLELPFPQSAISAVLGSLTTIFIIYRIVDHPTPSGLGYSFGIEYGIWLGLFAAIAITVGGYIGMREEGFSLSARGAKPTGTGTSTPPPPAGGEQAPSQPPSGGMPPMAGG